MQDFCICCWEWDKGRFRKKITAQKDWKMGVLLRGSRNEATLGISIRKEPNTELEM